MFRFQCCADYGPFLRQYSGNIEGKDISNQRRLISAPIKCPSRKKLLQTKQLTRPLSYQNVGYPYIYRKLVLRPIDLFAIFPIFILFQPVLPHNFSDILHPFPCYRALQ